MLCPNPTTWTSTSAASTLAQIWPSSIRMAEGRHRPFLLECVGRLEQQVPKLGGIALGAMASLIDPLFGHQPARIKDDKDQGGQLADRACPAQRIPIRAGVEDESVEPIECGDDRGHTRQQVSGRRSAQIDDLADEPVSSRIAVRPAKRAGRKMPGYGPLTAAVRNAGCEE